MWQRGFAVLAICGLLASAQPAYGMGPSPPPREGPVPDAARAHRDPDGWTLAQSAKHEN